MPKVTMERDGSKREKFLPPAFQPGGGVIEGRIHFDRDNVRWQVHGYEESSGRLWASTNDGSTRAWLSPGAVTEAITTAVTRTASREPRHEPVESAICLCLPPPGWTLDVNETGLWVCATCRRPSRATLDTAVSELFGDLEVW